MLEVWYEKMYIITGANGFLGNNIIRKLEQNSENEIRALVLPNDCIIKKWKINNFWRFCTFSAKFNKNLHQKYNSNLC